MQEPRTAPGGGGRGPAANWPGGWGGGSGRGGDDDQPSYGERLKRYRLGVLLALSSVVMLFVSFTTAYVVRKAGAAWDPARNDYTSNWIPLVLPVRILLWNTFVLVLSSVTLEIARIVPQKMSPWRRSPAFPAFASMTITPFPGFGRPRFLVWDFLPDKCMRGAFSNGTT